jgi:hypothetical protein
MTGRTVNIDEAMEKIGSFSAQDAIDLIESSQNVAAWIGKGGRGHPLQHCEMTTRSWPGGSGFQNLEALLDPQADGPGDIFRAPDHAAAEIGKRMHSLSWTDQHLIQAVRDLFLGNGAFTALYHLKAKGVKAKLVYTRPTSHTTIAVMSTSKKVAPKTWQHESSSETLTRSYSAVLYHCPAGRLQLQTLFAIPEQTRTVRIEVTGPTQSDVPFVAEFQA